MTGTPFVKADGESCGASMVKTSGDFPSEAPLCQRISSAVPQTAFRARGHRRTFQRRLETKLFAPIVIQGGVPCHLRQNTRSKRRIGLAIRGTSAFRAVAQLGRAPGSGPGGRGFKSHQPDCCCFAVACAVLSALRPSGASPHVIR